MQNELTITRNRPTLLRAEQSRAEQSRAEQSRAEQSRAESAECGFSSVAKNKITVLDDRRDEQG